MATFKFTTPNLRNGTYDMEIESVQNSYYNPSNLTRKFTVYKQNISIHANDMNSYVGKNNTLKVKIATNGVKSLINVPITVKINNSIIAKSRINSSVLKFNFTTPYLKKGSYKLEINTGDAKFYNKATITKKFTVYARNITINAEEVTGYSGKNISLTAKVTSGRDNVNISGSIVKLKNKIVAKEKVVNGVAKYSFRLANLKEGNYTLFIKTGNNSLYNGAFKKIALTVKNPLKSNIFANSIQAFSTDNVTFKVNVTDELNNTVKEGRIDIYLNNKKVVTKNVSSENVFKIPKQKIGVYNIKIVYDSDKYEHAHKTVKLTVNPKSKYIIKIVDNPTIFTNKTSKIRAVVRNANKATINRGLVKFYLNDKYVGSADTKNNLSSLKIKFTQKEGDYPIKVKYYLNNKFICADSQFIHVNKREAQVEQKVFITLACDLISNSKISGTKKDVYFMMDRTTADYDYSPNDMKIMNNIAYNLEANGFNVKRIRNGPGETYNTAKYMYNHNIKNSICFILCNGVDANVIREYLKGYDSLLTTMRKRGNDVVMGWFYGAGNIYDPDGEFYYWLDKAWDDNYSKWGGMSYPRKTAENDGIKIVYNKGDLKGNQVANSFIKLYGGKITESVRKNTTLSFKTNIYTTDNKRISGNIVYTLNGKIIKNVTTAKKTYTFKYKMPNVSGTYNLRATFYVNNKAVCTTYDRYIKVV